MHVEWLQVALDSVIAEAESISQYSPAAAERTVAAILNAVENLKHYPALGRPGRVAGTRELVISGTPYIVAYRVRGDTVELLLALHAARKWPKQF